MPFLGNSSSSTSGEKSGGKKWTKTLTGWRTVEQTNGKMQENCKEMPFKK